MPLQKLQFIDGLPISCEVDRPMNRVVKTTRVNISVAEYSSSHSKHSPAHCCFRRLY